MRQQPPALVPTGSSAWNAVGLVGKGRSLDWTV
jgi:hypothetical protein